jgi:O-antigen ligase
MSTKDNLSSSGKRALLWIIFLLLGSTTLIVSINSYDSGIIKGPLLGLFTTLLVAVFLAQTIWKQKLEFHLSPADTLVFMFLFLILVSTFYTKHGWESRQALAVWVPFIICFFAGTQFFAAQEDFDKLIRVVAAIAALVCVVGLIQFFFAEELFLDFFIGKERRVTSTLANTVYLSGYIVLLFPTLLSFTIAKERNPRERWMLGMLLCGLAFILVATSTRGSIAAFIVSIVLFSILSKRVKKKAFIWAAVGVLIAMGSAAYLSHGLIERIEKAFRNEVTSTLARRSYFWEAGYNAFKAAPYFGHGIGNYEAVMLNHRSPEYWVAKSEDVVPHAHNELIETAVDLGVVGLAVYLMIVATVLAAGLRTTSKENGEDRLLRTGLSCSLIAIFIDNLTNMSLRVEPVGACAWLLMGVLASMPTRDVAKSSMALHLPRAFAVPPLAIWVVFAFWYGTRQVDVYRADGHIIRGIFAGEAKDFAASISEYRIAVMLNPHSLVARSNLALALLRAGRADDALQAAAQLQSLSPRYPKSNLMQAVALVSLHRDTEALEKIRTELTLRNHPDAYFYQALACKGLSDTAGELSAFEHVLLGCARAQILYQLGPVSHRVGELAQKEEDIKRLKDIYEQLHALFPSDRNIVTTLAAFCTRLGESTKASELLGSLPSDPIKK